jgi:hypothetical protein
MLKLDQKYFIPFIAILGIIGTLAIFVFSLEYADSRTEKFMAQAREFEWKSLELPSLDGNSYPIQAVDSTALDLLFVAGWSNRSLDAADELLRLNLGKTMLLVVKDSLEIFAATNNYPRAIIFDGTGVYQNLKFTGVPTLVRLNSGLQLDTVIIGFSGSEDYMFIGSDH